MLTYILMPRSFSTVSQQINKFCFHIGTFSHRKSQNLVSILARPQFNSFETLLVCVWKTQLKFRLLDHVYYTNILQFLPNRTILKQPLRSQREDKMSPTFSLFFRWGEGSRLGEARVLSTYKSLDCIIWFCLLRIYLYYYFLKKG